MYNIFINIISIYIIMMEYKNKNNTEHFKDIKKNNIINDVNIYFKGISFSLDF